jgi:hypothetical protein
MTATKNTAGLVLPLVLALALTACGGGGSSATIGGTINDLSSGLSITLQNNLTDDFTITGNGSNSFTFAFADTVGAGGTYSATVLTQPLGQTCVITNPSGTVDGNGDDVNSVIVDCSTTSSVVGTVSGLNSGVAVTLSSNGSALLLGNGSFAFPGVLTTGSTYDVTVTQQPSGQTCTVTNPTGTVVANTSSIVTVTCS